MGPCFHDEVVKDVGESYFSLMIDKSTDVSFSKNLCLAIRYFSEENRKIVSTFYSLVRVEKCDADGLTTAILEALAKDHLSLVKLLGIGTDNASVMTGCDRSVYRYLKDLQPGLILVRCICHSLALAASRAVEVLPRQLEYLTREVYNWFGSSDKRRLKYAETYQSLTETLPLRILRLSRTRWLSRYQAVERIMSQWDELKEHFRITKDTEKDLMAEQLYGYLSDPYLGLYFAFLKPLLKLFASTNVLFQSQGACLLKLSDELMLFYKSLLSRLCSSASFEHLSDTALLSFSFKDYVLPTNAVNYGAEFSLLLNEPPYRELPSDGVDYLKGRCRAFLVEAVSQVQCRLPPNVSLLSKLKLLSPAVATSGQRENIASLLMEFPQMKLSVTDIDNQWCTLNLVKWNCLSNGRVGCSAEEFWVEVNSYVDASGRRSFAELSSFALSLLSLPLSNAEVERVFSQQNIIKNKLRNRLHVGMVDSILNVRYGLKLRGQNCSTLEISREMLERFNSGMYASNSDVCEELEFEWDEDDFD